MEDTEKTWDDARAYAGEVLTILTPEFPELFNQGLFAMVRDMLVSNWVRPDTTGRLVIVLEHPTDGLWNLKADTKDPKRISLVKTDLDPEDTNSKTILETLNSRLDTVQV